MWVFAFAKGDEGECTRTRACIYNSGIRNYLSRKTIGILWFFRFSGTHTHRHYGWGGFNFCCFPPRAIPSAFINFINSFLLLLFVSRRHSLCFSMFSQPCVNFIIFFYSKDVSFLVFNCFQFYLNIHARSKVRNSVLDSFFCFARVFFFGRLEADFSSFEGLWVCWGWVEQ